MKEAVVGIDIGGTFTKLGVVDRVGNMLMETSIPTNDDVSPQEYVADLSKHIQKGLESLTGNFKLVGIGIGAPNGNYYTGMIEHATNLKWKQNIPFVKLFKKHFEIPVVLTNDANAAAIGEMVFGHAKGMKDFIVLTLGTGLGSGIVANGRLIMGHDGLAGELGHVLVHQDGRECGCGRRGCLETYVSATGIKRTVYKLLADFNDESELRNVSFENLSSEMITQAAVRNDPIAIKAFEHTGKIFGQKIADFVVNFSPEAIFLFGGLVKAGQYLMDPTRKYMDMYMMPLFKGKTKLLISGLMDKNAAILGAAALVYQDLDSHSDLLR